MIIKIIEHTRGTRRYVEEGVEQFQDVLENTGREWSVEIPIESDSFKKNWLHIKGDLYQLIQHLRGAIR